MTNTTDVTDMKMTRFRQRVNLICEGEGRGGESRERRRGEVFMI